MTVAIKIENLSKQYRLGLVSTRTLSHDLNRWWQMNIHGKDDPYLKIGEVNDHATRGESEYVWALRDINLEVREGEVLGIIGKNGAGKSTLLKILSKVTAPTTGTIKAKGRIASLLEVGTGFHPEMTGRENIFMNGAILGMTKSEIQWKFDEIVDFAGVERFIDTPVKRYSSGMIVRLGFAVAAYLDPEILVVDEVLAVGDAEFQKKAIGKMQDISKGQGRTVLFVSHNLGSVEALCSKTITLNNGVIIFFGETNYAISQYILDNSISANKMNGSLIDNSIRHGSGEVIVTSIEFKDNNWNNIETVSAGKSFNIVLSFINKHPDKKYSLIPGIGINSIDGIPLSLHHSRLTGQIFKKLPKNGQFILKINNIHLVPKTYLLHYSLVNDNEVIDSMSKMIELKIIESNYYGFGEIVPALNGSLLIDGKWTLIE